MKAFSKQLRQHFAVIRDLLEILGSDTFVALAKFEEEAENPARSPADIDRLNCWLKATVRTFFAQVEGLSYAMRWFVVQAVKEGHIDLEPKVIAKLQERRYDKVTGELGPPVHHDFDDNLKNALKYFPRIFGCEWTPTFQGLQWEKFLKLLSARNAFTHPKEASDLFQGVAGSYLHASVAWFTNTLNALLMDLGRQLGREIKLPAIDARELSDDATSKLDLIRPPVSETEPILREARFMGLVRRDTEISYRLLMDGFSVNGASVEEISPLAIRLLARSLFTEIEAIGYLAQRILFDSASKNEISFSEEEAEQMGAKELTLKIAHLAEIFSRKFGADLAIERTGKTWETFLRFADFRDRITHPKDKRDLEINLTKSEFLEFLVEVLNWFLQILAAIDLSEKYPNLKIKGSG